MLEWVGLATYGIEGEAACRFSTLVASSEAAATAERAQMVVKNFIVDVCCCGRLMRRV